MNVIEGKQFKKPRAWRDASLGIGRSEGGGETENNLGEETAEELQERPCPKPQAHLLLPSPAEYVGKFKGGCCSL